MRTREWGKRESVPVPTIPKGQSVEQYQYQQEGKSPFPHFVVFFGPVDPIFFPFVHLLEHQGRCLGPTECLAPELVKEIRTRQGRTVRLRQVCSEFRFGSTKAFVYHGVTRILRVPDRLHGTNVVVCSPGHLATNHIPVVPQASTTTVVVGFLLQGRILTRMRSQKCTPRDSRARVVQIVRVCPQRLAVVSFEMSVEIVSCTERLPTQSTLEPMQWSSTVGSFLPSSAPSLPIRRRSTPPGDGRYQYNRLFLFLERIV